MQPLPFMNIPNRDILRYCEKYKGQIATAAALIATVFLTYTHEHYKDTHKKYGNYAEIITPIKDNLPQSSPNAKLAGEYARTLTNAIDNDSLRQYICQIDSASMKKCRDFPQTIGLALIHRDDHMRNHFIQPSIGYVEEYMRMHNINSINDVIEFSNTITYQDSIEKWGRYWHVMIARCVKTPLQTLYEETGDCDDMSLLYYTMFSILKEPVYIAYYKEHTNLLIPASEKLNTIYMWRSLMLIDDQEWSIFETTIGSDWVNIPLLQNPENIFSNHALIAWPWEHVYPKYVQGSRDDQY